MSRANIAKAIGAAALAAIMTVTATACQFVPGVTAANQANTPNVRVGTLTVSVEADGNVLFPRQQKLAFEIPGTVASVTVAKGDMVTQGQVVARLDDSALTAAVRQKELAVAQVEQQLVKARYDLDRATEQIEEAAPRTPLVFTYYPDMPLVRDRVSTARQSIEEAMALNTAGETAEVSSKLDAALKGLDEAYQAASVTQFLDIGKEADVSKVISNMRQLTYQKERAQSLVEETQVSLESGRAALAQARDDVQKATLKAPFAGLIADVPVKVGDRIAAPGANLGPVALLVDPTKVEVEALVDELDIAGVQLGQQAVVEADALRGKELKGNVVYISGIPNVKAGVVSYRVTIRLNQPEAALKDGMTVNAQIAVEQLDNVVLAPEKAVKGARTGQPYVEVLTAGSVEHRNVTLGKSDGREREITAGLSAGERVAQ